MFAGTIGNFLLTDRIAVLNLAKNQIGDEGVLNLMGAVKICRSLVVLNISSNEISGTGFIPVFEAMEHQESLCYLDISTHDGANRNRMNKKTGKAFYQMLISNRFLEHLIMLGVNLGN